MSDTPSAASAAAPVVAPSTPAPESVEVTEAELDAADASESGVEPAASGAKKPEVKTANKKKYKLKVDGQEIEEELDLDNEEAVREHLQMSKAARKRMAEVADYKKNVANFFEALQKDPLKVLSDPRLNISEEARKKMAEAIINNEVEELQKSPEQREKEALQRELETLKKQHEDAKTAREQAEFTRLQEQAAVQLDNDITSAIETGGLPKTSYTVKKMAEALMFCLQNDLDLSPKDIVPYIKKNTLSDFKEIISSLPDEEFEEWLGKDQITRIRKRNLARLKKATEVVNTPETIKSTGETSKAKEGKAEDKIAFKDFFKSLGK
jgi:hypothetical protein